MDAFDLAIRQLSTNRLRAIAIQFSKNTSHCETRKDFVDLLDTLTKAQRITAMKESMLAGRTSMALLAVDDEAKISFHPNFEGLATEVPTVVTSGKPNEIVQGLQHVQWAMTDGQTTFLNRKLDLKVEPEAVVIDSFYDANSHLLQIRGNHTVVRKIGREWAKLNSIDFDTRVKVKGLTSLDEVHDFCDRLEGRVRKCTGDKREGKGFQRVSGMRSPDVEDLRGTPDYAQFVDEVDMLESQIEFRHDEVRHVLGIGLTSQSIVFVTSATEELIQHVYGELKEFLKI